MVKRKRTPKPIISRVLFTSFNILFFIFVFLLVILANYNFLFLFVKTSQVFETCEVYGYMICDYSFDFPSEKNVSRNIFQVPSTFFQTSKYLPRDTTFPLAWSKYPVPCSTSSSLLPHNLAVLKAEFVILLRIIPT